MMLPGPSLEAPNIPGYHGNALTCLAPLHLKVKDHLIQNGGVSASTAHAQSHWSRLPRTTTPGMPRETGITMGLDYSNSPCWDAGVIAADGRRRLEGMWQRKQVLMGCSVI